MDSSFQTPPPPNEVPRSTTQRRRNPLRTLALGALLLCVALVGVGSVILSSRASNPKVGHVSGLPVVALYQPAPASDTTPKTPPAQAPGPCNCTPGVFVLPKAPPGPSSAGQYILVSLSHQWLWAYQNGKVVMNTPVTTGRPGLDTPTGVFSVLERDFGITMVSPWPPGSPNYYYPTFIHYAMLFDYGGYFLHDAWWKSDFGPGTNVPHYVNGVFEDGSHGCIEMPKSAAYWMIGWVGVGARVVVEN
ncbi:MAG: L,D-transpeptidase family protein [Ktedonobacterales bacterium]